MAARPFTRRQMIGATLGALTSLPALARSAAAQSEGDLAIDSTTALLFPVHAPLQPADRKRDARAVWAYVPPRPDSSTLLFLHGYNNYVTVDARGRSRVPDWGAEDSAARAGAQAKPAAPLVYGLDRLASTQTRKSPVVLVPEDGALAHGSFWATTPRGQYTDPARLGILVAESHARLARLRRPDGEPYLPPAGRDAVGVARLFLCGHSGAGRPLQEAAGADLVLPRAGVPTDLWLFDCTYWSDVSHFVQFCARWHDAGRLAAGRRSAARFVCVYRPHTQTEAVAEALRGEIAKALRVAPGSLVRDHVKNASADNFAAEVRLALSARGALFVRTSLPHDDVPTYFIPRLLETAA